MTSSSHWSGELCPIDSTKWDPSIDPDLDPVRRGAFAPTGLWRQTSPAPRTGIG